MGKSEKEQLKRALNSHLNTIHETLQVLDQSPASSLDKVSWEEVIKRVKKSRNKLPWFSLIHSVWFMYHPRPLHECPSVSGMLWTGETPEVRALEENMAAYFNMLQGFLLLSHGSTVDAGHTLSSSIHASVKQVVDCSFKLFRESVSSYGSHNKDQKLSIPQLVGADVLREMKELKPGSSEQTDETYDDTSNKAETEPQDDDSSCEDDLGNDLTPEEMKIAKSATEVVSEMLVVTKELIRTITEVAAMKSASEKISSIIDDMQVELGNIKGTSQPFLHACDGLRNSLRQFEFELGCPNTADLEAKMQDVTLSN
ncbi:hypothetical protein SLA2020_277650 [Shorea laevis]